MRNKALSFISVIILLFLQGPSSEKYIKIFLPNGEMITAELAVTDEQRQQGLMFREKINSDQGMLFIFEDESVYSFWMKNMQFSIDILWLNREKRIVHIEHNVPPCEREPCPSYVPSLPAMYVLELKAGSVEEKGLKLYDKLDFILEKKEEQSFPVLLQHFERRFSLPGWL